jgi:cytochrome c peroxidase
MSSSFRIRRRFPNLVLLLAALTLATPTFAQDTGADIKPLATKAAVALGERLFSDPRMSSTGSMSCASCHRPDRAFTEDKPQAVGQAGVQLGRNTPTLLGLASVKEFPIGGTPFKPVKMVSLEERVVLPLRDVTEMCATVGEAVDRLCKDHAYVEEFNSAFEEEPRADREPAGVTGDRMATALAAYIRSLRPREGPALLALAGSNLSLDESVGRGLDVFREEGRCNSCHSGPGLTDGQMHVVSRLRAPTGNGFLVKVVPLRAKELDVSVKKQDADTRPAPNDPRARQRAVMGGAYGQNLSFERQTLTLLEVKRTAPYFRDGSVAVLADAVRQHVTDLRAIGAERAAILENPNVLFTGQAVVLRAGRVITWSASVKEQLSSDTWIPPNLTSQQLDDLVSFLDSLSPTD